MTCTWQGSERVSLMALSMEEALGFCGGRRRKRRRRMRMRKRRTAGETEEMLHFGEKSSLSTNRLNSRR